MNDLTSEDFWNSYWSSLKLPVTVDLNFKNDQVIAQAIISSIHGSEIKSALEIGCAPGKWLSFIAKTFDSKVTGIEYVAPAAQKTIENLEMQHIQNYRIITGDFFKHELKETFDLVISLGFIEHFSNYESVLDEQLKLVSKNGFLVVGIPRFKGINYMVQKGIDYFIQNKLIVSHNLSTMNLEVFESFAKKNSLQVITNTFIGGFEPGLFPVAEIQNRFVRIFFKIILRICNIFFGNTNSFFTSSYQIAIYKK